MRIKDLIYKLQELYDTYDDEYIQTAGEPEIMIDVFEPEENLPHSFVYKGFSPNIIIEKSSDGVYDILSTFNESYTEAEKATKSVLPP